MEGCEPGAETRNCRENAVCPGRRFGRVVPQRFWASWAAWACKALWNLSGRSGTQQLCRLCQEPMLVGYAFAASVAGCYRVTVQRQQRTP